MDMPSRCYDAFVPSLTQSVIEMYRRNETGVQGVFLWQLPYGYF